MTTMVLLTRPAVDQTLSVQSVVIVMPTIGRELDIPESRLQWLVSSYSLTFGCFLLFWGRIADIYGKRPLFVAGSVWVTAMTAVNPFVPNEVAFQVVRALHGLVSCHPFPLSTYVILACREKALFQLTMRIGRGCQRPNSNRHPWRHVPSRQSQELRLQRIRYVHPPSLSSPTLPRADY
jgi:MFS family permease